MGNFIINLLLVERGRSESPSTSAVSQVPSARNSHYAEAVYFGVARSDRLY